MTRREFLACLAAPGLAANQGTILVHEHILVDFIGADQIRPGRYDPDEVFRAVGRPFAMIDCFLILDDKKIRRYLELGCEVKGMGRGHIKRIKESIRKGSEQ